MSRYDGLDARYFGGEFHLGWGAGLVGWLSLAVLLFVAVGAACQVLSGVGFALVCSPLLVLTLGHDQGVRTVLVMSIVLNMIVLARSFRNVRVADAVRLFIPAAIAVIPTVFLAGAIRTPVLSLVAGAVIVLATALVASGRRLPLLEGTRGALTAGAASGIFNVVAAASGPPVALFAAQRRWSPVVTSATLQAFALPLNVITFVILKPAVSDFSGLGWAVAGLIGGTAIATAVSGKVPAAVVGPVTLIIATVGGVTLIATAISALI